jgi:effector-binding domain-containing protein
MNVSACEIVSRPVQPTVCLHTVAPVSELPRVLGEAFSLLMAHLGKHGELPAGPPFVGYCNMDMQALEIEVGFPVSRTLPAEGRVEACEIPAGEYASTIHVGPYQTIERAYAALSEFIASRGREATGISYEFYLNDPAITPQDQLQTQILFGLK